MFNMKNQYTSIILVIGNEILSGKTQDTNSRFLASRLFARGIDVIRCVTIPDIMPVIVSEIRESSPRCDFLFSMGGIGSTPDDLTRQAFAEAFNRKLVRNPEAESMMRKFHKDKINEMRLRMADLPENCSLIENPFFGAPGFIVENCYVLPGVPEILVGMYENIEPSLPFLPRFIKKLRTDRYEGEFADIMTEIQDGNPDVRIGSYPAFRNPEYAVELTFDGRDENRVDDVMKIFEEKLKDLPKRS